jgi:DNA-binding transcriptional LysR family regulator
MDETLRWDDLHFFVAAHEAGSFSAAARRLMTEQSTVSRRIAQLERRVGAPLFVRSRAGLTLTEAGERILPLASEARDRINDIAELAHVDEVKGVVRLALTESMAVYAVIATLERLFEQHPRLQVSLVTSSNVSDLGRKEADVALRLFQPQRDDLHSTLVAQIPSSVWAHRRWAHTPWDDLEWIDLAVGAARTEPLSWVRTHAPRQPRLTTNGFISMVEAVRHGVGAAVMSDSLALQTPDLVRIETTAPPPRTTPVYLVSHRASRHVPSVAAVWDFLEAQLHGFTTPTLPLSGG